MANPDLVRTKNQLEDLADALFNDIKSSGSTLVSRYIREIKDRVMFIGGRKSSFNFTDSETNKEDMNQGIYSAIQVDDLRPDNLAEVGVARDLNRHRFHFVPKGIALPNGREVHFESIPSGIEMYDQELQQFSKDHPNVRLSRILDVTQQVIVNSKGGVAIQSIPFFNIIYHQGYEPIPTARQLSVVCNSEEELRKIPSIIRYIADPTPSKKIKNAKSLSEAFHELNLISGLKHGTLEEAGIPLSELYDVVMLTGVPIHEIFGHHFEEPIRLLEFGESGTFKYGQSISNKNITIADNPHQRIEGLRVLGFTHFDAYGRKRERRVHVENGQVKEFLGGEYADPEKMKNFLNLEKSHFVGNSSQHLDGYFPQPRMSCTTLDGKTENVDLEGKILLVPHEGHTNSVDKTYFVKSSECYVVRNGVPRRIIPLQVTGGINQALANLILLNDTSYQTGECGKPEPLYYPNSRGSASVPVSQFTKSQMWKGQQVYPVPISDVHLRILHKKK